MCQHYYDLRFHFFFVSFSFSQVKTYRFAVLFTRIIIFQFFWIVNKNRARKNRRLRLNCLWLRHFSHNAHFGCKNERFAFFVFYIFHKKDVKIFTLYLAKVWCIFNNFSIKICRFLHVLCSFAQITHVVIVKSAYMESNRSFVKKCTEHLSAPCKTRNLIYQPSTAVPRRP